MAIDHALQYASEIVAQSGYWVKNAGKYFARYEGEIYTGDDIPDLTNKIADVIRKKLNKNVINFPKRVDT